MPPTKKQTGPFTVLVGINYPPGDKRAEPGDVVDDLPAGDIGWMLEQGLIERASTSAQPREVAGGTDVPTR